MPPLLRPGQRVLDRYVTEAFLGRGGMGAVWRGRHQALDQAVAIKLLTGDHRPAAVERFRREARLMARVRHPHVVGVLDYGVVRGPDPDDTELPCLVLELVAGGDLDGLRRRRSALPWPLAARLLAQALDGLAAVHDAGIVHRDLKGENLLLDRPPLGDDPGFVKVADFGIARSLGEEEPRLTRPGMAVGTLGYMAPEQLAGAEVDARADLYAVGVLLWHLVAGRVPFREREPRDLLARLWQPPPPLVAAPGQPAPPDALVSLVARLMAPERGRRPARAEAVARQLRDLADRAAPTPAPAETPAPPAPPAVTTPLADWSDELVDETGEDADLGSLAGDWRARLAEPSPAAQPPVADTALPPTQAPAGATAAPERGFLLVARPPVAALRDRRTRRWLAGLFPPGTRTWTRSGLLLAASPDGELGPVLAAVEARWSGAVPLAFDAFPANLVLTSAVLTGAAPLPAALQQLVEQVG